MSANTIDRAGKAGKTMGLVSLAIVILAPLIYRALPENYRGATGTFGIGLGVVALIFALVSMAYSIRRKGMGYRWGKLETWLRVHTYAGLLALLFAFLHANWRFQPGTATAALCLLILTNISGFIGSIIYIYSPKFLAAQGNAAISSPEEVYSKMSKLQDKIDRLKEKMSKADTLDGKLSEQVSSAENELRFLDSELKLSLRREMLMGIWLYIHIPLSAAFLVTALTHVFVILYL